MPSWWRRNSRSVTQQDNQERLEDRDEKKFKNKTNSTTSAIRNNNKKKEKYREKQKSLDESELFTHNSLRKSLHLKTSSVSFSGSSAFLGFDSIAGNEIVEKKAYPLPRPSSPYEPRINFNEKLVRFGSVRNLYSSRVSTLSSPSSSSSSSTSDGENDDGARAVACDHGDFGSFRAVEGSKLNSWSRTSFPGFGLKTSTALTSLGAQQPRDASLDSPSGKQEKRKHPCHPLPLPPVSPTTSSKNLDSKWKKGKLLGSGTFGHVYAGFNSENGQMCAIKEVRVISDDHSPNECLKQLNQEISLLRELSHPNIVQYYGSNLRGDELSVYLEYVSGGSIRKLLGEYGPFAEPVIQSYTKQILSGLAYLHGRNTVHRDIKGANILVDPNGEIKLADFGMAKHITSFSSMLSLRGSPYWMAPEVIMNTGGQSLAVDIWSLGCTILEMATSKPPWSQYEGVAAIFKIANCKDYPEIPNYLSEDAQRFVKLCLQRDPSARPTAAQLLHHPFIQNQDTREVAKFLSEKRRNVQCQKNQ